MRPHQSVAVVAVAVVMVTAGCGLITGEGAIAFEASPATVNDQVLSESGYEEGTVTDLVIARNVSVAGQTRQVEVTNQLAQYERQAELGTIESKPAAVFVVFASPEVSVGTKSFNPIGEMSEREILQQFDSAYDAIEIGGENGNQSATVLGQSADVVTFEGSATLGGTDVDVYVHAVKLQHEGDHIVAVAIHPQKLAGEEETVLTLLEAIEHSGSD